MQHDPEIGLPWRRAALLAGGLLVCLLLAMRPLVFGPPVLEWGDLAVNALQIDAAKQGRELYGNYSRFHFNHPGPAFFYVYAAGEYVWHDGLRIVRSPHQAHLLAGLVLQVVFFTLAVVILSSRLRAPLALALCTAVAAAHYGWAGTVFTSIWPPYVLALPFLCLLVAGASAASGRPRHGLVALLAAGFLVHGHVAQGLFVGGLGAVILVAVWRQGRRSEPAAAVQTRWRRRHTAAALVMLALFALPLSLDLLQHGFAGNTATLFRRFIVNTGDAKTPGQALLYFASFATPVRDQHVVLHELASAGGFIRAQLGWWLLWAVLLGAVAIADRRLWPRLDAAEKRFVGAGGLLWLVAVLLAILWGLAQAGPMFHFNGAFFISIYAFPLLFGAAALARLTGSRWRAGVSFVCYATAVVILLHRLSLAPLDPASAGEPVRAAVDERLAVDPQPERPKLLLFDAAHWSAAAAVALQLERQGIRWYTLPRWNTMFQERRDVARLGEDSVNRADGWVIEAGGSGDGHPPAGVTILPLPRPVHVGETVLESSRNLVAYAWSGLEITQPHPAFTVASRAQLVLQPQPVERDVRIVFDAAANRADGIAPRSQTAEIFFQGEGLGTVTVGERAEVAVIVAAAHWNAAAGRIATLELHFPDAVRNESFSRPRSRDAYAWTLWSVRFEPSE